MFAFSHLPRFLACSSRARSGGFPILAPLNSAGLEPNRASKLLATLFRWLIEPMPHLQGDGMRPQGQKGYWPDDECAHDEQDTA